MLGATTTTTTSSRIPPYPSLHHPMPLFHPQAIGTLLCLPKVGALRSFCLRTCRNSDATRETGHGLSTQAPALENGPYNPSCNSEVQLVERRTRSVPFTLTLAALGLLVSSLANADVADAVNCPFKEHLPVDLDVTALALGPQGPLLEEFWENVRRYGLYFLTVATGGIYSLLNPIVNLFRNPLTAILTAVLVAGSFYLLYLTLSTMLGLTSTDYIY